MEDLELGQRGELRETAVVVIWLPLTWIQFAVYVLQNEETGIGGKGYDITKMSKREKKQYEYGRH